MSILTPSASNFPIPVSCLNCDDKLHKHGTRERHAIELGEKNWYFVQRFRCSVCHKSFTLLRSNMLPYKHYAAQEIEQVLQKDEDPSATEPVCGAEESTICRWKREFPEILIALAASIYSLAEATVSLLSTVRPLQALYDALKLLPHQPSDSSYLAWAYYVRQFHPVRIH